MSSKGELERLEAFSQREGAFSPARRRLKLRGARDLSGILTLLQSPTIW